MTTTSKKYNILFTSSWYPNRVNPTLGNFVQKHAEAVALNSNVMVLYIYSDPNLVKGYNVEDNIINGVRTINVYYKRVNSKIPILSSIKKIIRYRTACKKGLELVDKAWSKIDLVHHNILFPAGIIPYYLKVTQNIPYIISENWTGYLPSKKHKIGVFELFCSKKIAKKADRIVPVSADLKKAMQSLGFQNNYSLIYNVVNTSIFKPSKRSYDVKNKFKFLHVSHLDDDHKNISGMLRVAKKMMEVDLEFEFWIVGDGELAKHIVYAKELGVYEKVVFFDGTKTTAEIAALIANSDCFVLFSNYENLPLVIIESLASGVPVISTDVGGIAEHLSEDMGILISARDEAALLNAMLMMKKNVADNKYDKDKLVGYAVENFSYENVSRKFLECYTAIIEQKNV